MHFEELQKIIRTYNQEPFSVFEAFPENPTMEKCTEHFVWWVRQWRETGDFTRWFSTKNYSNVVQAEKGLIKAWHAANFIIAKEGLAYKESPEYTMDEIMSAFEIKTKKLGAALQWLKYHNIAQYLLLTKAGTGFPVWRPAPGATSCESVNDDGSACSGEGPFCSEGKQTVCLDHFCPSDIKVIKSMKAATA